MAVAFLGPDTDAYVASVARHVGEFTERTGIDVDVRIIDSDTYFSNDIHGLLDGEEPRPTCSCPGRCCCGSTSAPGSSSRSMTHFAGGGLGPRATSSPRLLEVNRWTGTFGRPARRRAAARGSGQLRVLQPRLRARSILERSSGSRCRQTWDDYFAVARASRLAPTEAVRGFGQRGLRRVAHDVHGLRHAGVELPAGATSTTHGRCRDRRRRRGRRGDRAASSRRCAMRGRRRLDSSSAGTSSRSTSRRGALRAARRLRPLRRVLRGRAVTPSLVGRIGYALPPGRPDGERPPEPVDVVARR